MEHSNYLKILPIAKSEFGNRVIHAIRESVVSMLVSMSSGIECELCGTITCEYVIRDFSEICRHCARIKDHGGSINFKGSS